jgi:secreted PhoX family phosphatase
MLQGSGKVKDMSKRPGIDRRGFLRTALAAGGLTMAAPLEALLARMRDERAFNGIGYGPLSPAEDGATGQVLLHLPQGFRYTSFGWTGDPLRGGRPTPRMHDGMAAFPGPRGTVVLVRNHEVGAGESFGGPRYDRAAGGGTTTLIFDPERGRLVEQRASLTGTVRNCAGGPTPWGTWLTCEESVVGPGPRSSFRQPHGYVFEVPSEGEATAEPLVAMGRFVREAVAVDPATGIVYQTEDARESGFYRFIPAQARALSAGGRLQMLVVKGSPSIDLRSGLYPNARYGVTWVDIDDPDRAHADDEAADGKGVFAQGRAQGGAAFARLEGAWYGGGLIYFISTSGGDAKMGQVWELDPARDELRLVYESPGKDTLNMPDNICVSPRGGLVLCEDGTENPCMHGLTRDGRIFRFARNSALLNGRKNHFRGDYTNAEFAGATFSPDGRWLFVNIQSPGFTVAITGPWESGIL